MRTTRDVPLGAISIDRYPLNAATLALVEHLRGGGSVPPIHLVRDHWGRLHIQDGRHRYTAYKLLGRTVIRARYATTKPVRMRLVDAIHRVRDRMVQ